MSLDDRLKAAAVAVREMYPDNSTELNTAAFELLKAEAARRERAGLLAEQRHQLYDLDADSCCPIEGACSYPYLRTGGQS